MPVVLDDAALGEREVEVRLGLQAATVGDLLDALPGADDATGILIDGRFCHAHLAIAEIGLYEGASIAAATGVPHGERRPLAALELRVIAGYDAGRSVRLQDGAVAIGREHDCDLVLADAG